MSVQIFKQGTDNWGYLLTNKKGEALAIDPFEKTNYLKLIKEKNLKLLAVLTTHYHPDHILGIPDILQEHPVPVYGPLSSEAPDFVTEQLSDGPLRIESFVLESYFLPGHCKSHCVYRETNRSWTFAGDLLFHLGCGRVMDGKPEELFESLQRIKDFPIYSEIFVGHDYRDANYRFCQSLDPSFYSSLHVSDLDKSTTLEMEAFWNPFLRASSFDEWWDLRQRRNEFR